MQQSTAIDEQVNVMLKELGIDPVIGMSGVLHLRELKRSKSKSNLLSTKDDWQDSIDSLDQKVGLFVSEMKALASVLDEWPEKMKDDVAEIKVLMP